MNAFHAPEGRANLVASLQHESRQIQALQEENRQMEYAIQEMEHGMEMMMAKHREIIVNFRRSDKMLDLLATLQSAVRFFILYFTYSILFIFGFGLYKVLITETSKR